MNAARARPANVADLKRLIRSLNDTEAEYILIGGYALACHGYTRATTDIDLLVPQRASAASAIIKGLMVLADQSAQEISSAWFDDGETIRVADEFVVNLLFNAGGNSYTELLPYVEIFHLDGVPIRTLNLEGLLRTKQGAREKDIADRRILERALKLLRDAKGKP